MNLDYLAQRIREFRRKRGMTLEQLAERSQLTQSVLSKVENSRVTPSLAALSRISEALGVTLADLVSGIDEQRRMLVVRRKERPVAERDRSNPSFVYRSLAPTRRTKLMEPYILEIPPGKPREDLQSHEGEELLLVLKGTVDLECGNEECRLAAGDAVYLEATEKHRISNPSNTLAQVLFVVSGESHQ